MVDSALLSAMGVRRLESRESIYDDEHVSAPVNTQHIPLSTGNVVTSNQLSPSNRGVLVRSSILVFLLHLRSGAGFTIRILRFVS